MAKKQVKEKEPEKKQQVNICWTTGNYRERKRIVDKLKAHIASQGEFELSVYDSDASMEYVQSQVSQRSCFDDVRRLIIFNDWPSFKTTKPTMYNHFLKMCQEASEDVIIVCNNLKTESTSFLKGMNEIAKVYEYPTEIKQWEGARWVMAEMAKREKDISEADAESLVQAIGTKESGYAYDIDKLYTGCDRLTDYIGKRKNITADDIAAVFTDSMQFIVWNMYPCLDRHDLPATMKLISEGIRAASDPADFVEKTLYSMIWRYRLLLFAKEGAAQGWNVAKISEEIAKLHKLKRTGTGLNARYSSEGTEKENAPKPIYSQKMVEKTFDSGKGKPPIFCYERKELFVILEAVESTLHCIRAGVSENEAIALLDGLVMTICGVGDPEQLSALRSVDYARYN